MHDLVVTEFFYDGMMSKWREDIVILYFLCSFECLFHVFLDIFLNSFFLAENIGFNDVGAIAVSSMTCRLIYAVVFSPFMVGTSVLHHQRSLLLWYISASDGIVGNTPIGLFLWLFQSFFWATQTSSREWNLHLFSSLFREQMTKYGELGNYGSSGTLFAAR
jgi:hypothetical protein